MTVAKDRCRCGGVQANILAAHNAHGRVTSVLRLCEACTEPHREQAGLTITAINRTTDAWGMPR